MTGEIQKAIEFAAGDQAQSAIAYSVEAKMLGLCPRGEHDWLQPNIERALRLYQNQAIWPAAAAIAATSKWAVEYLEQCPVLVLAVSSGVTLADGKSRQLCARQFASVVERDARLLSIMRMYRLPTALRQIRRGCSLNRYWPVYVAMREIPNEVLAQSIPKHYQSKYVRALRAWNSAMVQRGGMFALDDGSGRMVPLGFSWAVKAFGVSSLPERSTEYLVDYVLGNGGEINPKWTTTRLWELSTAWHLQGERDAAARKLFAGYKIGIDDEADFSPFPLTAEIDGYEFVALNSPAKLIEEHFMMHHCVDSYAVDVMKKGARLYSIRKDGKRVATVDYRSSLHTSGYVAGDAYDMAQLMDMPPMWGGGDGKLLVKHDRSVWRLTQIKGPCNTVVAPPTLAIARKFISARLTIDPPIRRAGSGPPSIAIQIADHLQPLLAGVDMSKLAAHDIFGLCLPEFANAPRSALEAALRILISREAQA